MCISVLGGFIGATLLLSQLNLVSGMPDALGAQERSFHHEEHNGHLPQEVIAIIALGDLMMGGSALPILRTRGPYYPFLRTRDILRHADVTMANLEAPFTRGGNPFDKTFTFQVPPDYGRALTDAGFDVLTLANNHIMDYGPEGLFSTRNVLDSLGILYCGAGQNIEEAEKGAVIHKNGWKLGFLAYSLTYPMEFWATSERCGTAYPHLERFRQNICALKKETDLVIVSFHWGGELMIDPKPYQRFYAHGAIDCGADLIVGHHPHVLQGLELYKNKLIAYSLGNFVFGSYSHHARESVILKVWFDQRGFLMAEVVPISVLNSAVHFCPYVLRGAIREKVINHVNAISHSLNKKRRLVRSSGIIVPLHQ